MPDYEYECDNCNNTFTIKQTFEERDRHEPIKCPACQSTKVHQLVSAIHLKTAKKS